MDTELVLSGLGACVFGLLAVRNGWRRRRQHRLVTGTDTSAIRDIDAEGRVEIEGEVVGPADGSEPFTSPVDRRNGTVLAAWEVEEWNESRDNHRWETVASGIRSRPFVVDDGTDRVRVAVGDRRFESQHLVGTGSSASEGNVTVDDIVCEFEVGAPVEVGAESETPAHIRRFVDGESGLAEQTGSITNVVDVGRAHGDRRYYEGTLAAGDDVYVLGHVAADEDATTPLRPEDATVTPVDGEPFVVSDRGEAALRDRLSDYGGRLVLGAILLAIGVGALAAGLTPAF